MKHPRETQVRPPKYPDVMAMIRNEKEYQEAVERLKDERERLREQETQLKKLDLAKEEIKRVLDPVRSFHEQLKEEVDSYQVSRDERNEYHGITLERAGRLLEALGADTQTTVLNLAKSTGGGRTLESRAS